MPVTIFRNRLRQENVKAYYEWADKLNALAVDMPGYVAHKTFTAEDGERVTIVEFADEEGHMVWAKHPVHREAMALGRSDFYEDYEILICDVRRRGRMKK